MSIRIRPLVDADLDAAMVIDAGYAAAHGVQPLVNLAALRFFERSGHSFVAEQVDEVGATCTTGFVLAQAIWSGERPTVHAARLAVAGAAAATTSTSLVKALVKSAYDSGVYDLYFRTPASDVALREALTGEGYLPDDHVTLQLVLGARGQGWAEARRA